MTMTTNTTKTTTASAKRAPVVEELDMFRAGSRKNKTYSRFVRDPEMARAYARRAGIKTSTIDRWFHSWSS
jgi:hypothetical protein